MSPAMMISGLPLLAICSHAVGANPSVDLLFVDQDVSIVQRHFHVLFYSLFKLSSFRLNGPEVQFSERIVRHWDLCRQGIRKERFPHP
jgi:hypothetical protein